MLNRLLVKSCKKKNKGIIVWGRVVKNIKKTAIIQAESFHFNKEWGQENLFQKFSLGHLDIEEHAVFIQKGFSIMHGGCSLTLFENSRMEVGCNVMFNNQCEVYCSRLIKIGNDVVISNNVIIRDSDIHQVIGKQNCKPIVIGDHVWIGTNSIILKGVTIGDGAIVGAGSVVTKNVSPNTIVAGNPAHVVAKNIKWIR